MNFPSRENATDQASLKCVFRFCDSSPVCASKNLTVRSELADAIVDLTETGTSLRQAGFRIIGLLAETSTRLIKNATSLGGVQSTMESRYRWEGDRVPECLLRLSVGLEDVEELWADLEQALSG